MVRGEDHVSGDQRRRFTKPEAIVEALQSWHETDAGITVHFDKWNNQLVHRFLVVGVKKNIPDNWDYFDVLRSIPEK